MANNLLYTAGREGSPMAWVLDTSAVVTCGDAGLGPFARFALQISTTGSFALSLRKKVRGSAVANVAATTPLTAGYENGITPGTVIAGTTAITAAGNYIVPCAGSELILDFTQTTGVTTVEYRPVDD